MCVSSSVRPNRSSQISFLSWWNNRTWTISWALSVTSEDSSMAKDGALWTATSSCDVKRHLITFRIFWLSLQLTLGFALFFHTIHPFVYLQVTSRQQRSSTPHNSGVTESFFMLPQNPCNLKWAFICMFLACKWVCEDTRRPLILSSQLGYFPRSYFWLLGILFLEGSVFGFVMPLNIPVFYQRHGFNT